MTNKQSGFVTLIGSTELTEYEWTLCSALGYYITEKGFSMRSGRAPGADQAFQNGAERFMATGDHIRDHQIFLPWKSFEHDNAFTSNHWAYSNYTPEEIGRANEICATVHPVWGVLTSGQRAFHTRNVFQSLGLNCNEPSDFLICCAAENKKTQLPMGGSRTAFKIAQDHGTPCLNIRHLSQDLIYDWVDKRIAELKGR